MANNINQTVDQLNQSLSSASNSVDNFQNALNGSVNDFRNAMNGGNRDVKEFGNKLMSESWVLVKQFGTLSKTLSQGNGTLARYNNVISTTTNAVGEMVGQFGLFGKVLGTVIKLFGSAAGIVNEFNDNLLKGYDVLARLGTAGNLTTDELYEMARNAGYSNEQTVEFTYLLKEAGSDVLILGNSASDGYKALGQLTHYSSELIAGFSRLGITNEDLIRNTVDYVKLQASSGISIRAQNMSTDELRKRTVQYTRDLMTLSDINAQEIEETKRKQKEASSMLEIQVKNLSMQQKIDELRANKDDKLAQEEADRLETQRENMMTLAGVIAQSGHEQTAAMINVLVTEAYTEASQQLAAGFPGINEMFQKMVKSADKIDLTDTAITFNLFLRDSLKRLIPLTYQAIGLDKSVASVFGISEKLVEGVTKNYTQTEDQMKKDAQLRKKIREFEEKYSIDDRLNQRAGMIQSEQNAKRIRDALVNFTDKTFYITTILTKFGEVLSDITGWIGNMLIDADILDESMRPLFMSTDQLTQGISSFTKEIAQKEKELSETQTQIDQATAEGGDALGLNETLSNLQTELVELNKQRKSYENALRGQTVSQAKRGESPELEKNQTQTPLEQQERELASLVEQYNTLKNAATDLLRKQSELSGREQEEAGRQIRILEERLGLVKPKISNLEESIRNQRIKDASSITESTPAKFGGIFTGPLDGYDAPHRSDMTMHQTELIQPLSQNSILQELATKSVSEYITQNAISNEKSDLMPILISRVDELIRIMRDSNNIQNDILNYSIS